MLADLEPRIPTIHIVIEAKPPGLVVRKDGAPIPIAALSESIRVDPGAHEIVAQAPGYARVFRKLTLAERQNEEVTIVLTKSDGAPPVSADDSQIAMPDTPPSSAGSGQRTAGLVVGGVGVLGVGAAVVLGIITASKSSAADNADSCKNPSTNAAIDDCNAQRGSARQMQTGTIIAAVAGGVALAGGVVLYATAPRAEAKKAATTAGLSIAAHPTGVSIAGRF
jgi:hypothetical protein